MGEGTVVRERVRDGGALRVLKRESGPRGGLAIEDRGRSAIGVAAGCCFILEVEYDAFCSC